VTAAARRRQTIYSSAATSLAMFGIGFTSGSGSLLFHQTLFVITFISLVTWRGYRELHIPSSKLFGMLAFG